MPFYEYQCRACGAQVEVMQKISDSPLRKCPECGKSQLTRLISAPVFRLKGAGWYETDFKSDKENKRNLVGAEKDAPAKDASSADAAKPADKVAEKTDQKSDSGAADKKSPAEKPAGGAAKPDAKPPAASRAASKSKPRARPAKRAAGRKARR
jgi:putative FmdB family regulatory protein